MPRPNRWFLFIPVIPTIIYVLNLLFYPSRDGLILWRREFDVSLDAILPLIVCVSLYSAVSWLLIRRIKPDGGLTRMQRIELITLVVLGSLAIQWSVTRVSEPDPLAGIAWRTYAIKSGGYWTVGAQVQDLGEFIANYTVNAPEYPVHQSRHPPGLSLIYWGGAQLFKLTPEVANTVANWLRPYSCLSDVSTTVAANQMAAGAFGIVVEIALAMLTVWPLYLLVKRVAGTSAAVIAALLYPLTPGFGMWVAQDDRIFPLVTITVLLLCEAIVTENSNWHAFLAGLLLSLATFASFGNVPMALIACIYVLVRITQTEPFWRKFQTWRKRILQAILVAIGSISIWLLSYIFYGLNPIELYKVVISSHLSIDFPYWPFVAWHPWDIITFIGLPVVAITALAGWKKAAPLTAAFCVTLLVMSVLHIARGETGRVWLFFTPVAVAAAAVIIARKRQGEQALVILLLAIQLIVMAGVLRILNDYGITPAKMPAVQIPSDATTIDTRFGASGQIALLGYKVPELRVGAYQTMTLYWQRMSPEPINVAYKVFIHVATNDQDQTRVASDDTGPVDWLYPTTCWQPGQIIEDIHPLTTSIDTHPGQYPIFVGLYDPHGKVRPPTFASPPSRQMYGSILLPQPANVTIEAR